MKRPFLPLVLAIILGIIFAYYIQITTGFAILILGLFLCMFILGILFEKRIKYSLFFLFVALGILLTLSNKTNLGEYINTRIECKGIIDTIVVTSSPNKKYIVKINSVNNNRLSSERLMLTLISEKDLKLGDIILFNGILKEGMENTNPKLYNYRLNLLSQKIYTTMTIKDYQINIIKNEDHFKYRIKERFKNDIENLFTTYLNPSNSKLITSIILGESSYLEEDSLETYRELGLAHVMAISGLHIGIISGFLIYIFSRLGVKRKINIFLTLGIIWTYGFLVAYPPSILRASIMLSLLLYSSIIHEPYDWINTLSLACFLLLAINPYYLFNIGFQLSFVAAFSIVFFTPYIKQVFYPYKGKLISSLSSLLAVNLGILPFQAYYFNRIGMLSIIANLILIPIFSIALILGFIMVASFYLVPFLNMIIGPALNFMLSLQEMILGFIPSIVTKVYSPEFTTIILYFILLLIILRVIHIESFKKPIVKTITLYLIFLIMINFIMIYRDNSIELHFIDVGQGDSILIRTKAGDYLMDTGGSAVESTYDISKNITLPYLEKLGINRLKAIFITHFHADHCQGLPLLVEKLKVDNIIASYLPKDNNLPIQIVQQGQGLILDKNTKLWILWPDKTISDNENNMSLVALLTYYNTQVLLTGDIEREVEPLIAEKLNTNIDILKVPHHGSKTSSTENFLEILRPSVSIISVGRNNLHNHPSNEVVNRYNDFNSTLYRTDENGRVKVKLNKENYSISSYIKNEKIDLFHNVGRNIIMFNFILLYIFISYLWIKIYIKTNKELGIIEL